MANKKGNPPSQNQPYKYTTSKMPEGVKTSGIVVRGGKAQTKGKMARGPMG